MGRTLTDQEAIDRLAKASDVLGVEPGQSVAAQTALEAARRAMTIIMIGLEGAVADGTDEVPGIVARQPAPPHEL